MSRPTPHEISGRHHQVASGSAAVDVSAVDVTFTGIFPIALRVDGAGTVAFTAIDGTTDTWTCVAGDVIPVAMASVQHTGTSATGLHALYAGGHA